MIAHRGLKNPASLAWIQRKNNVFKLLNHSSSSKPAYVPSFPLTVGKLLGYRGELSTSFKFGLSLLDSKLCFGFVQPFARMFNDMCSSDPLGRLKSILVPLVGLSNRFFSRCQSLFTNFFDRSLNTESRFDLAS